MIECEETINKPLDKHEDVITEVLIHISLARHKEGFSLELLNDILDKATANLSSFRIHHTPEGMTITGRF